MSSVNFLMGKIFIVLGLILVFLGILFLYKIEIPFLGKLPGDIVIKGENFTFYFPLMTSILLSIIFSLLVYFFSK